MSHTGTPGHETPDPCGDELHVAVGQMAAGVAHEFNNVLAGILACAEDTLENSEEPETKRNLRLIIRKVERACLITDKLLYFARQGHLDRRPVDLAGVLEGALTLMVPLMRDLGVAVIRHFQPVGPVSIDAPRMEQVFLNLFRNAAEAMNEGGGRLTVELFAEGTDVVVRIEDTGPGISPELRARVFEPFFTSRGILGGGDTVAQGLGLSSCQGIVHMHGGTIDLGGEPGQGVVVTIRLG